MNAHFFILNSETSFRQVKEPIPFIFTVKNIGDYLRKHDGLIGTTLESRPHSFLALQYRTLDKRKMGRSLFCRFRVNLHKIITLFFVGLSLVLRDILDYFVKQKIQNCRDEVIGSIAV
jgi:hypothetical protein